jgi:signal transduction histidine kinase
VATVDVPRSGAARRTARAGVAWWEVAVAGAAVAAAAVAVTVTLRADFLAYPGWLAVQKADFILGPVFVGLYWHRRRPHSRFGPILIAVGFVGALYALQSSGNKWVFSAGLLWEDAVGLAAYVLLLTFPTGRLDGLAARLILVAHVVLATIPAIVSDLLLTQVGAGASISGCRARCPDNALAIASRPAIADDLYTIFRYGVIATALATAGLLVWRFATGTPPRRRAFAIGAPVGFVFLLLVITFHLLALVAPHATDLRRVIAWALVVARAAIWYGFLAALIAAQLFAARALQRLVRRSLSRPAQSELEAMVGEALGDPQLRLAFWNDKTESWAGVEGSALHPPPARSGLDLTVIEDGGRPAVAILHDAQLNDDPELLHAAGAVSLIAAENAELDGAWHDALDDVHSSRARIAAASARERLRLERDLHDGAQQRLFAIQTKVDALRSDTSDEALARELEEIDEDLVATVAELRSLAHGLYPATLRERGVADALRSVAQTAPIPIEVVDRGIGRLAEPVEEAIYFSAREAIQNATKHAGRGAKVVVTLERVDGSLVFAVADDGVGLGNGERHDGMGITSMRDRVGAVGGRLEITSRPRRGTVVRGSIPVAPSPTDR